MKPVTLKPWHAALLGSAMLFATPAFADSPFDGTWKGDPSAATIKAKPDEFGIKNGLYSCTTCIPPFSVKADGAFHAVKDKPYWDEIAVKTIDDRTVSFQYRKGGKVIAESTDTVSADGNSLMVKASNTNNAAGTKIEQSTTQVRVGGAVSGAHAISGAWQLDPKTTQVTDNAITMTLKVDGGMLHVTSPMGETLDARIGGDFTPNVGDPGKTLTKVEMPDPRTLVLTDKRGDKIVQVGTYKVSADGTAMDGSWTDPRDGSSGTFKITKQ